MNMKLSVPVDLTASEIRHLLYGVAVRNPDAMDEPYPNRISVLQKTLREEIRRYGLWNRDGWSDDLTDNERMKIVNWAETYCRRFAL